MNSGEKAYANMYQFKGNQEKPKMGDLALMLESSQLNFFQSNF
jgi:hypothetical protein